MNICFKGLFEGNLCNVVLSSVSGGGSGEYHVLVDDYYHGCIFIRNGKWVAFLNDRFGYTSDDEKELVEIVKQNHCSENNV